MSSLAERLKSGRKEKGFSQQKLAELAEVHYTNIGKYERGDATPSASVLNRISQALELSPDYLINGTLNDKANNTIRDEELLLQFKKVEKLPENKKELVKEFLDAFLFKSSIQNQLAS
jgi:transcriptional regulator with XRE-family HTH domain